MGCIISCCDPNEQVSITCRRPRVPPAYVVQEPGLLARLGKKLRQLWQGDNGQCDIEGCDNGQCDIEQGDGDHIYERKVQILVEMGFTEDDVRGALNENACNEFLALLMLCAQNTNTK
ncbi:uncharacterized protein LOC112004703 [Quercus suber]|uniref:UBA domain-containing protein n=1 Tax=Quercus suber TaxID=58331 RepID=A0AAW0MEK5_QUESU|nr:uncharacterized protein LOC112004703 [Quercus suber]